MNELNRLTDELTNTAIQITCIDSYGKEVKRVTSADDGEVEDNEQTPGSDTGSNTQGGDNTGGDGDRDTDGGTNSDE